MLVSFCIIHKGGFVLYQHRNDDDDVTQEGFTDSINTWLSDVYLNPTISKAVKKQALDVGGGDVAATNRTVFEWEETSDLMALAIYPDLRHDDFPWIARLLNAALQEYQVFAQAANRENDRNGTAAMDAAALVKLMTPEHRALFDKTFSILFQQHRQVGGVMNVSKYDHKTTKAAATAAAATKSTKGKEKRQWHDGNAKVTKESMAELDRSKAVTEDEMAKNEERALAEARAAYLPTDADLAEFDIQGTTTTALVDDDDDDTEQDASWGKSLSGLFAQMTGQKVLTKQDLEPPLNEMHRLLTGKNVAADIASQICQQVERALVGKKLNSMYRVKTAVRQALEKVLNKLLLPSTQLDLLRQVVSKRDQASSFFSKSKTQRPYVIVVVGINGVGKSTSLAKLAYYLKNNGCQPLLAACDTFRSGAVEQLSVHARCLGLPVYSKGYSKDPSAVATAAIEEATKNGNDVVLVDTAGRMQNNMPLMKALGKLAYENKPDMVVFVGEALVGNDGVDQVKMFDKAVSFQNKSQRVSSIILTKFDTVSDKVGAALTMTHVTNAPILFVGTGQKYHHLQKLSTASVIKALFR
jgi:signal recognition particle receptor subunit alpha